jgi:S1 RNA binding domain protein
MHPEVGAIYEGRVTGITKFGAFVTLPDGSSGLVHISEIADAYVKEVTDYLQQGQTVKVKVIGIGEGNKINLSIKKVNPPAPRPPRTGAPQSGPRPAPSRPHHGGAPASGRVYDKTANASFEDKLKQFMQESDSRNAGNKLYPDKKGRRRRDN